MRDEGNDVISRVEPLIHSGIFQDFIPILVIVNKSTERDDRSQIALLLGPAPLVGAGRQAKKLLRPPFKLGGVLIVVSPTFFGSPPKQLLFPWTFPPSTPPTSYKIPNQR